MWKLHFTLWWWNQVFWVIPSMLIVIYNFIYKPPYDLMVWEDSQLSQNSKTSQNIKDFKESERGMKKYKVIKGTKYDRMFKVYVISGIIYYIADSIYLASKYGFEMEICETSMFIHHICTLIAAYFIVQLNHYPWFLSFSIAFHCFLILFPFYKFLNYVYFIGFLTFGYAYTLHPWNTSVLFRKIFISSAILVIPLAMIQYNRCDNANTY